MQTAVVTLIVVSCSGLRFERSVEVFASAFRLPWGMLSIVIKQRWRFEEADFGLRSAIGVEMLGCLAEI